MKEIGMEQETLQWYLDLTSLWRMQALSDFGLRV